VELLVGVEDFGGGDGFVVGEALEVGKEPEGVGDFEVVVPERVQKTGGGDESAVSEVSGTFVQIEVAFRMTGSVIDVIGIAEDRVAVGVDFVTGSEEVGF